MTETNKDATTDEKVAVAVSIEVSKADYESTINDLLLDRGVFGRDYIGYWACGVALDEKLGWLVHEEGQYPRPREATVTRVCTLWRAGVALPAGWYRLDRAAAEKAVAIGLGRWGVARFENAWDANDVDIVVQLALLNEVRYG